MTEVIETRPAGRGAAASLALAAIGCLLSAGAVVLVVHETRPPDRALAALVHVAGIALPVGVGLLRLWRQPDDRFARLLVGVGLAWSLTTLAESSDSTLYSIGRWAVWLVEPALVYLMLAFPYGRLTTRAERRLFAAVLLVAALLYVPAALMAPFPEPSPWATCGTDCPQNAFALGNGQAAFVDDVVRPLREVLAVVLFACVAWTLVQRARRAPPLMRRALAPVAAISAFRLAALVVYQPFRASGRTPPVADVLGWIYVASLPLVTVAFAVGLLRERLFVAKALERLTLSLRPHANATELRAAMANALQDPPLQIAYWIEGGPGRWVDETGWPVKPMERESGRAVTEVAVDGRRIAAIGHDVSLSRDPALIQAAMSYALAALENERLVGELHSSLQELSQSRTRLVSVADRERRRIERDLHDGAQQRLAALRARLGMVAERIERGSPASAAAIRALADEVELTIDEVRSFARGIYPSLLVERGLSEALRSAGRSAPLPTMVDAAGIGRYSPEIEATVYFACLEALQNAARHARGASGVKIAVWPNPNLHFEVHDDGQGFDPDNVTWGAGITNLRDRLAAVGGELHVESAPGKGTRITGVIPVS